MEVNIRALKERTARAGSGSGREAVALEEEFATAPLSVEEGDAEAVEEEGADEVVNRNVVELDEDDCSFDEVVDAEGNEGREVSTLPTVTVVGMMVPVCVRDTGMEKVVVADAKGEEKDPDIPSSLKNGENPTYSVPFSFAVVEVKAM